MSFNSTSWYSGNHEKNSKAYMYIYIYITNTASSAMEITVSDRCTAKFKYFMALHFSRNQATVTLVIILAHIKRGKLTAC